MCLLMVGLEQQLDSSTLLHQCRTPTSQKDDRYRDNLRVDIV